MLLKGEYFGCGQVVIMLSILYINPRRRRRRR